MSVAMIVDTSIWIDVLRDGTQKLRQQLESIVDPEDMVLTRCTQLELLQGARNDREWNLLRTYLSTQEYLTPRDESWVSAARIYFELRRDGLTVRSPIDCLIAQLALEHELILLHRDRDFVTIAKARPLVHSYVEWQ